MIAVHCGGNTRGAFDKDLTLTFMTGGESKPAVPVLEHELSIRIRVANGCSELFERDTT